MHCAVFSSRRYTNDISENVQLFDMFIGVRIGVLFCGANDTIPYSSEDCGNPGISRVKLKKKFLRLSMKWKVSDVFSHRYSRLCTDPELRKKVPSLCQKLGADDGRCMSNIPVLLRDGDATLLHKRAIAVCYKDNKRFKCLTAGSKVKEVLIWDYTYACDPDKFTDKLGSLPKPLDPNAPSCSNCFGYL